jgi:hypothetical protein
MNMYKALCAVLALVLVSTNVVAMRLGDGKENTGYHTESVTRKPTFKSLPVVGRPAALQEDVKNLCDNVRLMLQYCDKDYVSFGEAKKSLSAAPETFRLIRELEQEVVRAKWADTVKHPLIGFINIMKRDLRTDLNEFWEKKRAQRDIEEAMRRGHITMDRGDATRRRG